MEGPKAPNEARRREAPERRGMGYREGRRSPSPVWGQILRSNLCIFMLYLR